MTGHQDDKSLRCLGFVFSDCFCMLSGSSRVGTLHRNDVGKSCDKQCFVDWHCLVDGVQLSLLRCWTRS